MIYVHVPFCRSFCSYCDFYSEIVCKEKEKDNIDRYLDSLIREINSRKREIDSTAAVDTLYFGGGTPSALPLSVLSDIVRAIGKSRFREFTVEVNPEDIVNKGDEYVSGLLQLGVNRISMGVQSFDDGILKWMNRRHNADTARKAFRILRNCGCDNISLDLIFGISHLSSSTLSATVDELMTMTPEHISAYQLSIEEGSALAKMVEKGKYSEADEELCRSQYDLICARLGAAGYHHYEISNWGLPGREAVHNSAYWDRSPYVGLGPGAHSLVFLEDGRQCRKWNSQQLKDWTSGQEILSEEEIREERLMLGLRTDKGVDGKVIPEKDWFISESIISSLV